MILLIKTKTQIRLRLVITKTRVQIHNFKRLSINTLRLTIFSKYVLKWGDLVVTHRCPTLELSKRYCTGAWSDQGWLKFVMRSPICMSNNFLRGGSLEEASLKAPRYCRFNLYIQQFSRGGRNKGLPLRQDIAKGVSQDD